MPTAAESMPLDQYIASLKDDSGKPLYEASQAAMLGAQDDARKSGVVAPYDLVRSAVPGAQPAPKANTVTQDEAVASLNAHTDAQMQQEMDAVMAAPQSAYQYVVPQIDGASDEDIAANSGFTHMLHTESVPVYLGNAIMQDFARDFSPGRASMTEHPAQDVAAVKPWITQLLSRAAADPSQRAIATLLTPEKVLSALSRETVIALKGFVDYRARR